MKKIIRKFIINCMCDAIQLYMSKHRFGFKGMLEMLPLTHEEFEKHIHTIFAEEDAKNYLEVTAPTTPPHLEQ